MVTMLNIYIPKCNQQRFSKITQNNLNFYLFKEVMINDKYYITDKNNNILINTNGHDY